MNRWFLGTPRWLLELGTAYGKTQSDSHGVAPAFSQPMTKTALGLAMHDTLYVANCEGGPLSGTVVGGPETRLARLCE